ncbi:uncharacterized protein METZ01_LOCUS70957, partial [marine metagenome]
MEDIKTTYLNNINDPKDLDDLNDDQLK